MFRLAAEEVRAQKGDAVAAGMGDGRKAGTFSSLPSSAKEKVTYPYNYCYCLFNADCNRSRFAEDSRSNMGGHTSLLRVVGQDKSSMDESRTAA